ncbi:Mediator of RNA polymerase II transcription subunit [Lachnellula hyalina]|uniref:Mediator of RNA polymerase II transcription subunit 21 n=1 Tax=Lachnellula hyalina TaxID=1316788 RepID=A0A8H8QWV5_9HELO|nr:Mediator of RNA polymerase II transcription subunit [Lachnellula hyalina]TVY23205.1 Mediator of RNA polymerase II transcription subunit [Lachnellula hyalina]
MADKLTQLQDAVDQLANQFVASLYYVHKHHDLKTLGASDKIREEKKDEAAQREPDIEPVSADEFKAGQKELAQDLIMKEQQIELLISVLPGLDNSENDQERMIRQLEDELKAAEEKRREAVKEKEEVLARLEGVIRSVKRP